MYFFISPFLSCYLVLSSSFPKWGRHQSLDPIDLFTASKRWSQDLNPGILAPDVVLLNTMQYCILECSSGTIFVVGHTQTACQLSMLLLHRHFNCNCVWGNENPSIVTSLLLERCQAFSAGSSAENVLKPFLIGPHFQRLDHLCSS